MDSRKAALLSDTEAEVEEGLELSLGLSLGGSYGKALLRSRSEMGSGFRKAGDDPFSSDLCLAGSGAAPPLLGAAPSGGEPQENDPQRRRELHALRRQEARRKRLMKAAASGNGRSGAAVPPSRAHSVDEKMLLEAREAQSRWRAGDRKARENDPGWAARGSSGRKVPDSHGFSAIVTGAKPVFPVAPLQFAAYQQYVPVTTGLGLPYMMPCWAPAVSAMADGGCRNEGNVFQPVPCRGFPLFPLPADSDIYERSGPLKAKGGEGIEALPASHGSSSSDVSDDQSGSFEGGSSCKSSNRRSNSCWTLPKNPQSQVSSQVSNQQVSNQQGHSNCSTACNQLASSSQLTEGVADKLVSDIVQTSHGSNPMISASLGQGKLERAASVNKPVLMAAEEPQEETPLPRMPCVSTTGNGPNGKTITGFLYRYNKSEVSIVCVCHGTSFSPAEFVKHAGGTNVSHPLRQIVVVPS